MKRFLAVIALLFLAAGAGAYIYLEKQWRLPYPASPAETVVEIPRAGAREVLQLLQDRNVIKDKYVALAYLAITGNRHKLQAGEYMFDKPMTVPEVMQKLVTGSVYLRKFSVPEGLTMREIAQRWEEQGFGKAEDFFKEAASKESIALIQDLDPQSPSLEGYLFPETYSFPKRTTERQAIAVMVGRFRAVLTKLQQEVPTENWPLELRQTVILASLIESEAKVDDERPVIGGVYLNRVKRHSLLQCDPTVIYALAQADAYRGALTLKDLKFESPYNTYVHAGLPPGPITNPGYPSLRAAASPASTSAFYFVRTVDGRHAFSDSLAAHNRAVAQYRALQRKK
jgi:UPF0755 protein